MFCMTTKMRSQENLQLFSSVSFSPFFLAVTQEQTEFIEFNKCQKIKQFVETMEICSRNHSVK